MKPDELINQVRLLPDSPGVYRFYNKDGQLLYVGKARSLKKRVATYFGNSKTLNRKTRQMVSETARVEFTVSASEFDALLLENNLIKEHQPRYNILLRDDKTYPYLCITNERFPRILYTRKYDRQAGEYFGPYSSVSALKTVLDLIRRLYTIRTCTLPLSEENIRAGKFKVCLEYHIGNCKGPCEGRQTEEAYNHDISLARQVLKGNLSVVRQHFQQEMENASAALAFEKAQYYKEKIELLDKFQARSVVVNRNLSDIDVLTVLDGSAYAYVNFMQVKEGAIVFSQTLEIQKKLEEPVEDLASMALVEFRLQTQSPNTEVISNLPIKLLDENLKNTVPKAGDRKKLVDLSLKNALELKQQRELLRAETKMRPNPRVIALQKSLTLPTPPIIMECFDNSNLLGSNPVAAMVRFVNGKPDKKNYRRFAIKTVQGPDDFASMKEVVYRRYKRILDENEKLPDLIIIDGGKGQLSSAMSALTELRINQLPVIGIAKRLEEIYRPGDPYPLHISKKSPALQLIQQIRDEAHRFALNYHRAKRKSTSITSLLDNIPGLGEITIKKLRENFKTISKIAQAGEERLAALIGKQKARLVIEEIKKAFHRAEG
ncbi:MAG: excinuclease ABC subunit UvrC [Cyclobacteriaceae bacterium]|nr:excinuclease ABC subunit UvrC [Cyclobacteriaceae bacterium]MCX7637056.1 excinuclease ABC subunit UvrC [Cyclobacteriaceae bacterium]MDW8331180.1 excinuclease ABC subunit UvrC [Cyclobacteriaceae bacterium]